jgi:multiple sugar transport system permease protein
MADQYQIRRKFIHFFIHAVLSVGAIIMLFPFVWIFLGSVKTYSDASSGGLLPREWVWSNYSDAVTLMNGSVACHFNIENPLNIFKECTPLRWFVNTIFVSLAIVFGVLSTGTLAAYAFARMKFPGRDVLFILLLVTMMIPSELTLIPNFALMVQLHTPESLIQTVFHVTPDISLHNWINTYYALIIPWTATAFSIFLFRQAFRSIPEELFDAALIDGARHSQLLWSVVLPLSIPVLITSALLTFLESWNALMWPLLVTNSPQMWTIQVGLAQFIGDAGMYVQLLLAATMITIIPILIMYLILQHWFVEGIASTGIRG